jgi:UDP-N-acetylmuramoyl-tripeptide--D-alanyl-D-alanine ligase
MQPLNLQEMSTAMDGRIIGDMRIPSATSVCTDSRQLSEGCVFIALRGPNFDGHTFVADALEKGAVAAVVSELGCVPNDLHESGRLIHVADTLVALGRLAAWYRTQFAAEVIAVVGSNGKTTTKDMIAAVLGVKRRGQAAQGSFNNAVGVPLTLLSVERADEFVVVEIGTNHPGEVTALARIARPDVAVITCIAEEHLEFFGNIEAVAGEEFSILANMGKRAFVAMSDQAARYLPEDAAKQFTKLVYGLSEGADLWAKDVVADGDGQRFKVNGRFDYRIPVHGKHNVVNAMAAIAIATRLRMTPEQIAEGLLKIKLPPMRMNVSRIGAMTLINDAYNANPGSMRAAFDVLDSIDQPGRKIIIVGDMRELGDQASACHQNVGRDAGRSTAHSIIAVGSYARVFGDGATAVAGTSKRIYSFPSIEALNEKLAGLIEPDDVVLIKASRGSQLERLVEPLRAIALQSAASAS